MFKKWLKNNYNMSVGDYKKLELDARIDYYKEYAASTGTVHKCPHCGTDMVSATDVWYGTNSKLSYDMCMAIVAHPVHRLMKSARAIVPTTHVCLKCGFMGMYLTKAERDTFMDTCTDLSYHSD